jgi:hypothetical protein
MGTLIIGEAIIKVLGQALVLVINVIEKLAEFTTINLGKILKTLGITFINLDNTSLLPFDHYFVLSTSPIFNI